LSVPILFLSHATEDNVLAEKLAQDFTAKGIKTFYSEWEIRTGERIIERINQGLVDCTHFAVLLTPVSITKPWVKIEMDAGLILQLQGQCAFVPIRSGLAVAALPPLFQTMNAPSIDDYDAKVPTIIGDIHGMSRAPALGAAPAYTSPVLLSVGGLSPAATGVGVLLARRSKGGLGHDAEIDNEDLLAETGLPPEIARAAVEDLEAEGLIRARRALTSMGPLGFLSIVATGALYLIFDQTVMGWDTAADGLKIAARLVSDGQPANAFALAVEFGWEPRRLNPALYFLKTHGYVECSNTIDATYVTPSVWPHAGTRRFVRQNA